MITCTVLYRVLENDYFVDEMVYDVEYHGIFSVVEQQLLLSIRLEYLVGSLQYNTVVPCRNSYRYRYRRTKHR
jgi:hypothetical protein